MITTNSTVSMSTNQGMLDRSASQREPKIRNSTVAAPLTRSGHSLRSALSARGAISAPSARRHRIERSRRHASCLLADAPLLSGEDFLDVAAVAPDQQRRDGKQRPRLRPVAEEIQAR